MDDILQNVQIWFLLLCKDDIFDRYCYCCENTKTYVSRIVGEINSRRLGIFVMTEEEEG